MEMASSCPNRVLYGLIAVIAAVLAIVNRDRAQWIFAFYFAHLIANELILTGVVRSVAPPTRGSSA